MSSTVIDPTVNITSTPTLSSPISPVKKPCSKGCCKKPETQSIVSQSSEEIQKISLPTTIEMIAASNSLASPSPSPPVIVSVTTATVVPNESTPTPKKQCTKGCCGKPKNDTTSVPIVHESAAADAAATAVEETKQTNDTSSTDVAAVVKKPCTKGCCDKPKNETAILPISATTAVDVTPVVEETKQISNADVTTIPVKKPCAKECCGKPKNEPTNTSIISPVVDSAVPADASAATIVEETNQTSNISDTDATVTVTVKKPCTKGCCGKPKSLVSETIPETISAGPLSPSLSSLSPVIDPIEATTTVPNESTSVPKKQCTKGCCNKPKNDITNAPIVSDSAATVPPAVVVEEAKQISNTDAVAVAAVAAVTKKPCTKGCCGKPKSSIPEIISTDSLAASPSPSPSLSPSSVAPLVETTSSSSNQSKTEGATEKKSCSKGCCSKDKQPEQQLETSSPTVSNDTMTQTTISSTVGELATSPARPNESYSVFVSSALGDLLVTTPEKALLSSISTSTFTSTSTSTCKSGKSCCRSSTKGKEAIAESIEMKEIKPDCCISVTNESDILVLTCPKSCCSNYSLEIPVSSLEMGACSLKNGTCCPPHNDLKAKENMGKKSSLCLKAVKPISCKQICCSKLESELFFKFSEFYKSNMNSLTTFFSDSPEKGYKKIQECVEIKTNNNANGSDDSQDGDSCELIDTCGGDDDGDVVIDIDDNEDTVEKDGADSHQYKITLSITGMTCNGCASSVNKRARSLDFVKFVKVDFLTAKATLILKKESLKEKSRKEIEDILVASITKLGFNVFVVEEDVASSFKLVVDDFTATKTYTVEEVADLLKSIEGVTKVMHLGVNGKKSTATAGAFSSRSSLINSCFSINVSKELCGARDVIYNLDSFGIKSHLFGTLGNEATGNDLARAATKQLKGFQNRFIFGLLFSIPVAVIAYGHFDSLSSFILPGLTVEVFLLLLLVTPVQFYVGAPIYSQAWKTLRYTKKVDMDGLVSLSTGVAYGYSIILVLISLILGTVQGEAFFETPAILLTLVMLGRFLEHHAKAKSTVAVDSLLKLQPQNAILLTLNEKNQVLEERVIHSALLKRKDIIKILPGQVIPTDGVVTFGTTFVDESLITGESTPIQKVINSELLAGAINKSGVVHMSVTKTTNENTLVVIQELISTAQSSKPSIHKIADRIASIFTPFIIMVSVVVFFLWFALAETAVITETRGYNSGSFALIFALSLLVISCPCAFGLAAPVAIMVAAGVAAKLGIFFKGGESFENLARVTAVVFDKTGTLTHGKMSVINAFLSNKITNSNEILHWIASTEVNSSHPIAKAIVSYCSEKCNTSTFETVQDFENIAGYGVKCKIKNTKIEIGTLEWINPKTLDEEIIKSSNNMQDLGYIVIFAAVDSKLVACFGLSDSVKEESIQVIQDLQKHNVKVFLMSGDALGVCDKIGTEIGIPSENIYSRCLPKDKAQKIKDLQAQNEVVAMVGDGINDSPALSQANVGISVDSGTDISKSTANIVLMKPKLTDFLVALDLSKSTLKTIKLNLAWAFGYNIIAMPISAGLLYTFAGVYIPPAFAGVSEVLSSVPVVLFSLFLYKYKPPRY